jgi:hypothetical protein
MKIAMALPGTVKTVGVQAGSGGTVLKGCGADLLVSCHALSTHAQDMTDLDRKTGKRS